MEEKILNLLGFDCGNSSVRTVLGRFNGEKLEIEVVRQVPNGTVRLGGYDYWDILYIFDQMQKGLKEACETAGGKIDSAGISTWGIDFGLFGPSGQLVFNPLCYRNPHGSKGMESLDDVGLRRMFDLSGIQNHPMNSVYQLAGIRDLLPEYYHLAEKVMLTPDLLNYLFTGEWNGETSMASTTGLMNMKSRAWDEALFDLAGIKKEIMPEMVDHGALRGSLTGELARKLDIPAMPFVSVPSHDTAAAVVTVPAEGDSFAFISSGTWSLIGTELAEPVINNAVYDCALANEGGACGTITLLKNSAGMHILQRLKKELEIRDNRDWSWDEMVGIAEKADREAGDSAVPLFDPNDDSLYNPDSMLSALEALTGTSDLRQILAAVYISLACNYHATVMDIEKIAEREFPVIHIIGGGSRNDYLNQLTADISRKPVISGPVEATSLGTVAVQLLYHFPSYDLQKIRQIVAASVDPESFEPRGDRRELFKRYSSLLQ